jgi:predicted short-subunit dehydrogenase-like oxidoreductase (DUF2520 family)
VTVYSRSGDHAGELASEVAAIPTNRLEEIPGEADVFLICVPDREVGEIAEKLSGRKGIFVHTAGALPMEMLQPFHREYGVIYPLQTLTKDRRISLEEVPILIEGSSLRVNRILQNLASGFSGEVHQADSATRLVFHLAAVFTNNFSNHMVHIASQLLKKEEKFRLLVPLLRETFLKLEELDPAAAQTGPAIRGDETTMEKHIDLLKTHPEWQKLYTFISRDIARSRKK